MTDGAVDRHQPLQRARDRTGIVGADLLPRRGVDLALRRGAGRAAPKCQNPIGTLSGRRRRLLDRIGGSRGQHRLGQFGADGGDRDAGAAALPPAHDVQRPALADGEPAVAVLLHRVPHDPGVVGSERGVGADVLQVLRTAERLPPGHERVEREQIDHVHQPVAVVDGAGQRQRAVRGRVDRRLHRTAAEPVDGLVGCTHASMIVLGAPGEYSTFRQEEGPFTGAAQGSLGVGSRQQEDRDQPVGLLLVPRVVRKRLDRPLPPQLALVACRAHARCSRASRRRPAARRSGFRRTL